MKKLILVLMLACSVFAIDSYAAKVKKTGQNDPCPADKCFNWHSCVGCPDGCACGIGSPSSLCPPQHAICGSNDAKKGCPCIIKNGVSPK